MHMLSFFLKNEYLKNIEQGDKYWCLVHQQGGVPGTSFRKGKSDIAADFGRGECSDNLFRLQSVHCRISPNRAPSFQHRAPRLSSQESWYGSCVCPWTSREGSGRRVERLPAPGSVHHCSHSPAAGLGPWGTLALLEVLLVDGGSTEGSRQSQASYDVWCRHRTIFRELP